MMWEIGWKVLLRRCAGLGKKTRRSISEIKQASQRLRLSFLTRKFDAAAQAIVFYWRERRQII
jgi:hypothetical protein